MQKKCKCVKLNRANDPARCTYTLNSEVLEQMSTQKHLGVLLSDDFSRRSYILSIAARANRLLGLLKRTFGKCPKALFTGYNHMVHPL